MNNDDRLKNLITFARARFRENASGLHDGSAYIRASASGFRAVCVSNDAPLCELGRCYVKDVRKALAQTGGRKPLVSETARSKRERRLQAHLIREALQHGGDLLRAFGPARRAFPFERLLFALDEVPLHDGGPQAPLIRCDLLAVGSVGGRLEPVLIELKWGRALKRLSEQLDGYSALVSRYGDEFSELLGEAIGHPGEVSTDRVHQMIVWPAPTKRGSTETPRAAERTRTELAKANVTAIQFDDSDGYDFTPEVIAAGPAWPRVEAQASARLRPRALGVA